MSRFGSIRIPLACLVLVVAVGTVVGGALQLGQPDSQSSSDSRGCAACDEEQPTPNVPKTTANSCTGKVCPVYVYMNHGDYCSWYALKCNDAMPPSPCNFDGFCNPSLAATSPCSTNCTNCVGTSFLVKAAKNDKDKEKTRALRHVDPSLKKGFKDKKKKEKGKFKAGAVSANGEEGYLVQFDITVDGTVTPAVVQLWDVQVTAAQTLYVGHQVDESPEDVEPADTAEQDDDHVYLVTYEKNGNLNIYTVMLHKDTAVPAP